MVKFVERQLSLAILLRFWGQGRLALIEWRVSYLVCEHNRRIAQPTLSGMTEAPGVHKTCSQTRGDCRGIAMQKL
jgi:hypothetical protein